MLGMPAQQKTAPSGPEILLRSLGMGEVLEFAKQMASAGTMDKILQFADMLPVLVQKLEEAEIARREQNERLERIEGNTQSLILILNNFAAIASAGSAPGGPVNSPDTVELLREYISPRRSGRHRNPGRNADGGNAEPQGQDGSPGAAEN